MCGIAAIYARSAGNFLDERVLLSMLDSQRQRGPDNTATTAGSQCLLGSNRLRVIDSSKDSDQPFMSDDRLVHIAFNGEVFNHRTLREPLLRAGVQFRTFSDTETILQLYLAHGVDMLNMLEGQFAICIFDQRNGRLFLARDRMGICPLYYIEHMSTVYVASSLKALLSNVPSISWSIDSHALGEYLLLRFVLPPRTIIRQIRAVLPAEAIVYERGDVRKLRYWRLDAMAQEASTDKLRESMITSVKQNMASDVPLGFFLSGGLDSTIVVAAAAQGNRSQLDTLSIHLGEHSTEETVHAQIAATAFGCRHHVYRLDDRDLPALTEGCWAAMDQPTGARDALATFALAKQLKQLRPDVKVVLTGTGADELFAGYCSAYFHPATGSLEAQVHGYLESYACTTASAFQALQDIVFHRLPLLDVADDIAARMRRLYPDLPTEDATNVLCTFYLVCHLPGWELPVQDMMCMASSLEARVPFLAQPVVEAAMRIGGGRKWMPGREKAVLRDAFADLLPPQICNRSKVPLSRPVAGYLSEHGIRDLYRNTPFRDRGIFDPGRQRDDHVLAEFDVMWRVLSLERWLARNLDQNPNA